MTFRLATCLALFALGTAGWALADGASTPALRDPDAFYAPTAVLPAEPGALVRSEPLAGIPLPSGIQGWRILYTTSVDDETPATAVATVFAPAELPEGPPPVIAWQHGTTGLLQRCMPSLFPDPTAGNPGIGQIAAAGWVVVATDYSFAEPGGPHPYLIGEGEARAGLDSVRAAWQKPELDLDPRTVVWGHSQGGHAALFTGIIAPTYAPGIDIAGIAALAPPTDLAGLLAQNPPVEKRLGPYAVAAYSRFYPDIALDAVVRPEAREAVHEIAGLCSALPPEDAERIQVLAESSPGPMLTTPPSRAVAGRFAENAPVRPIAAPLLVAQGLGDGLVLPTLTEAFVTSRCAAGQRLDYWTFSGLDHAGLVHPGSPLLSRLLAWTAARFAGEPQADGCHREAR